MPYTLSELNWRQNNGYPCSKKKLIIKWEEGINLPKTLEVDKDVGKIRGCFRDGIILTHGQATKQ